MLLLITILIIIVLYFVIAISPMKLCAICTAVSLTWLGLLITYFIGWHHDLLLIGILMGGSVVGFMYKLKKYFIGRDLTNFWLIRILIISFGFSSIYFLLNMEWNKLMWLTIVAVLISFFTLFFIKSKKVNNVISDDLQDKLDHCCD